MVKLKVKLPAKDTSIKRRLAGYKQALKKKGVDYEVIFDTRFELPFEIA